MEDVEKQKLNDRLQYQRSEINNLTKDLDDMHALIDLLPNSPLRRSLEEEKWSQTTYTVQTRLSAWLSNMTCTITNKK
jgi:hypothetical protein